MPLQQYIILYIYTVKRKIVVSNVSNAIYVSLFEQLLLRKKYVFSAPCTESSEIIPMLY